MEKYTRHVFALPGYKILTGFDRCFLSQKPYGIGFWQLWKKPWLSLENTFNSRGWYSLMAGRSWNVLWKASNRNSLDFNGEKQRCGRWILVSRESRLKTLAATLNEQSTNGFKAALTSTRHVCQGTTQSRARDSAAVRNQTEHIIYLIFFSISTIPFEDYVKSFSDGKKIFCCLQTCLCFNIFFFRCSLRKAKHFPFLVKASGELFFENKLVLTLIFIIFLKVDNTCRLVWGNTDTLCKYLHVRQKWTNK